MTLLTRAAAIRPATLADIDALERLEQRAFEADRISRRSFRALIASPTAACLVAETDAGEIAGYALLLFRAGTALARLYSFAVDPDARGSGIGARLLEAAERAAFERDRLLMRLEVREDNAHAIRLYERAGYHRFGKYRDYYADHAAALRYEKILRGRPPPVAAPYYEQTTEFTCGSACLLMALARFIPQTRLDRANEIRLWREASTVFLATGLGGCDPYGLAVVLARRGLKVRIGLSRRGPFFLETVRDPEKRLVMETVQEDFRREAATLGIEVSRPGFSAHELAAGVERGAVAIVLISGYRMFRRRVPHWVLAYGVDGRHLFIHDPWIEDRTGETLSDAAALPIPFHEFDRMSRWGAAGLRAAVLVTKG